MKRGRIKMALVLFAMLSVAVSLLPEDALGLPQFAVRFGSEIYEDHVHEEVVRTMDCRACHVNPTAGRIYVNVLTSTHLNGEIRGQLLVNPGTSFAAKLTTGAEGGGGNGGY